MIFTIKILNKLNGRVYRESVEAETHEDAVMYAMQKLGKKFGRQPYHLVEAKRGEAPKLERKATQF